MDRETNSRIVVLLVVVAIVLIGGAVIAMHDHPQAETRTRVPNFNVNGQELADLKTQLVATQAAAAQAQQAANDARIAKNDMQAQLEQLAKDAKAAPAAPTTTEEPKEGRQEMTRSGIVTDFGEYDLQPATNVNDYYVGFNFADRYGYTKRFFPVCPGQTVKAYGGPFAIIYHWRSWQENAEGKRGCFQIDGFQVQ